MSSSSPPLVLAFVADLMFGSKIETAVTHLGLEIEFQPAADGWIRQAEAQQNKPGEPLFGQDGAFFRQVVDRQPALLVFDLANGDIPWRSWLAKLKSSPATRRIPAVCYAPHVAKDLLDEAQRRGADATYPRSRFAKDLPNIIETHLRSTDQAALKTACAEPFGELGEEGIRLFNQGEYYECHHALEDAWNADQTAARELYRGILQVGVAYLQVERGNYRGAIKMLLRVRQWLDPLPDTCRGVDVAQLRQDAQAVYTALEELGPDRIAEFDLSLFKPLNYNPSG